LLSVAIRGLEAPARSLGLEKVSNAAKLGVCSASPNTAPAGFEAAKAPAEVTMLRLAVSAKARSRRGAADCGAARQLPDRDVAVEDRQLIPPGTRRQRDSMIFASSITWRSIDRRWRAGTARLSAAALAKRAPHDADCG